MDQRCQERAEIIEQWIDELEKAQEVFDNLECSEDPIFKEVYDETTGKVEERRISANANPKVLAIRQQIKAAKRKLDRTKRMYDLAVKAGDWEYGTVKIHDTAIKRMGA